MNRSLLTGLSGVLAGTMLLGGCGALESDAEEDDLFAVEDGKADNFFSTTAKEYYLDGTSSVVLEPTYVGKPSAAKLERAKQLMALKNIQIGWFLHVRLVDKTDGGGEHGDANAESYPGFHAMVRDGGYKDTALTALPDGKTYTFKVRLQAAGQKRLIDVLPGTLIDATHKKFTLQMGKVSNADLARLDTEKEWFRDSQWESGTFDPANFTADKLEPIDLIIYPQTQSTDGYLDVNRLFADGKLTVDVHYGWDYWSRYDVSNAHDLYSSLRQSGFQSPAASFETYVASAGPLTKTINANGKMVDVQVRIYHGSQPGVAPGPDPDTDEGGLQMEKDMYASLAGSDVVVFGGHSGHYYGFALANWKKTSRGALDYPQLREAVMPKDRYQIVVASGCDTFSIGQAFRENPNKPDLKNLDVITTTTFSNAGSNDEIDALMAAIYGKTRYGKFVPSTYGELLGKMNGTWDVGSMYGVHGINDNPRLHPFASVTKLDQTCTRAAQCGTDSNANKCTRVSSTRKVCSATCLDDSGCPTGFKCKQIASSTTSTLAGRQCLR